LNDYKNKKEAVMRKEEEHLPVTHHRFFDGKTVLIFSRSHARATHQ
jgi:hypothetical protein